MILIRILFVMSTFFFTYCAAALFPATMIMVVNAAVDPTNPWVCVADRWLMDFGIHADVSPWIVCGAYALIVFLPAIRIAQKVAFDWLDERVLA